MPVRKNPAYKKPRKPPMMDASNVRKSPPPSARPAKITIPGLPKKPLKPKPGPPLINKMKPMPVRKKKRNTPAQVAKAKAEIKSIARSSKLIRKDMTKRKTKKRKNY